MKRIFTSLLILFTSHFAFAQWNTNPALNNAICTAANRQFVQRSVTDGKGGAIITWMDYDGTNNIYKVYAQRISAAGIIKWATNGIAICTNTAAQKFPQIISDNNGGAIIIWFDYRTAEGMYAQSINAGGVLQWTVAGVQVAPGSILLDQIAFTPYIDMTTDNNGGAIIAWADGRDANGIYLYAQHINAGGVIQWGTGVGGLPVCSLNGVSEPKIISDNKSGAFIAFSNYSGSYPTGRFDIYAQHISKTGAEKWGANGIAVCTAAENQQLPEIIRDENGGAIIAWQDTRNSFNTNSNLFAQRVNGTGAALWIANGVEITPFQNVENIKQVKQKLMSDGNGGTIICWSDNRTGHYNVFSQRITNTGALNWGTTGVQMSPENYVGSPAPQLVTDGKNGAIITWDGTLAINNFTDIGAQRINAKGLIKWTAGGVSICTASDNQSEPQMVTDTSGSAIICWTDNRNNGSVNTSDIFASKVNVSGNLSSLTQPFNEVSFSADKIDNRTSSQINVSPNPATSFINITYTGKKEIITLGIYDAQGKLLKQQTQKNESLLKINVSDLIPGTYFIYLNDGITIWKEKFVKQ